MHHFNLHAIRVMTDLDARATVLSVVGVWVGLTQFDAGQVVGSASGLRPLIPFVRSTYAQSTSYEWEDQHGTRNHVWQHEGGEQGDPLMSLLFCLAVHNAPAEIQEQLRPREHVFAFLDDIFVVSLPERTRTIFNLAAEKLGAGAGIELHAGKTRVWNRAGECPPDTVEHGGCQDFDSGCASNVIAHGLWQAIKWIPDLQCAWQVLVQCAGSRCHTMPPSHSVEYAEGHDAVMQHAMASLLEGMPGDARQQAVVGEIASLPMRMGGLGIRSASRLVPAALLAF